ncbi:MAG TPA: M48 family metallopeptidase [Phycisphaerae bacterium]|nr:M48 family metallopeptidase [Phycisphaerae bacterium]
MRTALVLTALAALSLGAAGCSTNPVTGKSELIFISEESEIAMGAQAAPEFEKEFGGRVSDASLQAYVQEVGQRVARVSDRTNLEYEYTLVASKTPNAFALPGGRIFVTAGLMKLMKNERELAAVLGHETGHVCAKHNVKGMQRDLVKQGVVTIGGELIGAGDLGKKAAAVVGSMVNMKYSRDDEYQSDELGIRYMTRAGYNPWGMVELLNVLLSLSESEPGAIGEMLQTHPVSSKRIAEARQMIETGYAQYRENVPDPNTKRFLDMRTRLNRAVP